MKYKVGDKVKLKSKEGLDKLKQQHETLYIPHVLYEKAGSVCTIRSIYDGFYLFEEMPTFWAEPLIEKLVEEKTKPKVGTALNPIEPKSNANCLTQEKVDETKPEPKFKVGDSVEVLKSGNTYTISQMVFNGKEVVYVLSNNGNTVCWFSEEELKPIGDEIIKMPEEEETVLNKWNGLKVELELSKSVIGVSNIESLHGERFMSGFVKAIIPPDGYIFKDENGNVINATKIVLEKKKTEYPKTYEECLNVLGYEDIATHCIFHTVADEKLFNTLYDLKVCRDAYWKIAGEEMGLGKPWELSIGTPIYYIYYNRTVGTIKNDYADDIQGNVILAFPTKEMRDAFYENFKELIEQCKELL